MKCGTCRGKGIIKRKDNRYDPERLHVILKKIETEIKYPVCAGVAQDVALKWSCGKDVRIKRVGKGLVELIAETILSERRKEREEIEDMLCRRGLFTMEIAEALKRRAENG